MLPVDYHDLSSTSILYKSLPFAESWGLVFCRPPSQPERHRRSSAMLPYVRKLLSKVMMLERGIPNFGGSYAKRRTAGVISVQMKHSRAMNLSWISQVFHNSEPFANTCLTLVCLIFLLTAVVLPDQKLPFKQSTHRNHQVPLFQPAVPECSPDLTKHQPQRFVEKMSHHVKNNLMRFSNSKLPFPFFKRDDSVGQLCRASPSLSKISLLAFSLNFSPDMRCMWPAMRNSGWVKPLRQEKQSEFQFWMGSTWEPLPCNRGFFGSDISLCAP